MSKALIATALSLPPITATIATAHLLLRLTPADRRRGPPDLSAHTCFYGLHLRTVLQPVDAGRRTAVEAGSHLLLRLTPANRRICWSLSWCGGGRKACVSLPTRANPAATLAAAKAVVCGDNSSQASWSTQVRRSASGGFRHLCRRWSRTRWSEAQSRYGCTSAWESCRPTRAEMSTSKDTLLD